MRGLESAYRKAPARCPLFEPGVVNHLGRANVSAAQNGAAIPGLSGRRESFAAPVICRCQ